MKLFTSALIDFLYTFFILIIYFIILTLKLKGLAKSAAPKLSIGDSDSDVKKNLIESKPHCQISNLPTDVFDLIVNYVQK